MRLLPLRPILNQCPSLEKVVAIIGATGSGKSRLSVTLATHFHGEVINSDKIQLYKGLDITTNKIPHHQRHNVPHHLLGEFNPFSTDFITPTQFRSHASASISSITHRGKLPILAGGSNSYIYALLSKRFSPDSDFFSRLDSVSHELRYNCCFLWVHVAFPVLKEYLLKRVDEMIDSGMVGELAQFYNSGGGDSVLRKAIGVPEFERYFREDQARRGVYDDAVREIKENTCQLAKTQMEKIERLRMGGWDLHKLDGTDSFKALMEGSEGWSDVWERQVVAPSVKIVKRFLNE